MHIVCKFLSPHMQPIFVQTIITTVVMDTVSLMTMYATVQRTVTTDMMKMAAVSLNEIRREKEGKREREGGRMEGK